MKSAAAFVMSLLNCLFAGVPSHARTATAAERRACEEKIQEKIDAIDSKLRAGYPVREGERLKERRRKLEAERAGCRARSP
jgi:hypothetical protein